MKAVSRKVDKLLDSKNNQIDINNDMDGIVIVLFPVDTWNRVQDMARKIGMETSAVISVALEMMEDEMLKKERDD